MDIKQNIYDREFHHFFKDRVKGEFHLYYSFEEFHGELFVRVASLVG